MNCMTNKGMTNRGGRDTEQTGIDGTVKHIGLSTRLTCDHFEIDSFVSEHQNILAKHFPDADINVINV